MHYFAGTLLLLGISFSSLAGTFNIYNDTGYGWIPYISAAQTITVTMVDKNRNTSTQDILDLQSYNVDTSQIVKISIKGEAGTKAIGNMTISNANGYGCKVRIKPFGPRRFVCVH